MVDGTAPPAPRSTTRERMVDAATELFALHGYGGVGLSAILEKSGAPRGSMYHHFPGGKAQLAAAVIDRASTAMVADIDAAFADAASVAAGDRRLIDRLADEFVETGNRFGCPVSNFLQQAATDGLDARALVRGAFAAWTDGLARHYARLGLATRDGHRRARRMLVLLEGAWVVAAAEGDAGAILELKADL